MSPSTKTLVIASGSTVLIGGVAYVLWRRCSSKEDREEIADTTAFAKKTSHPSASEQKGTSHGNAVSSSNHSHPSGNLTSSIATDSGSHGITKTAVELQKTEDGVHVYDGLGIILKLEPNWKVSEDVSPLPNVAMITLQHTNYSYDAESMPGKAPVLILSVEDVSLEKLDVHEFKEKSKLIALRQMHAMTNGMVPPNITFDGSERNGRFQMKLQYSMICPMLQLQVVNYIAVENELAYVLQFMATPDVFQACESDVRNIARNIQITNIPSQPLSHTDIACKTGFRAEVPVSWIIQSLPDVDGAPLVLETPSPTKPDRIEIQYKKGGFSEQDLKDMCEKEGDTKSKLASEGGYKHGSYATKYNKTVQLCAKGNVCVRVTPMQASRGTVSKAELQALVDSVEPCKPEQRMIYRNRRYSFSFHVQVSSRLVESRVGDTAITLAPEGVVMDPSSTEPKPLLTIRVGDPTTEADCETSLEGWMARMTQEFALAGAQVTDLRYDTINNHSCVTFSEVQMQETMVGQEEHKAKVIVFVQEGRTYMLRWEVPKAAWTRFEPKMYKLLQTFNFSS